MSAHLQLFSVLFVCLSVCSLSATVLSLTTTSFFLVYPAHALLSVAAPHSTAGTMNAVADSSTGSIVGKVTFVGTPKKFRPIDMSTEPNCAKFYTSSPVPESSITGPHNSLQNVIVYISKGAADENASSQSSAVRLSQLGCRYSPHVIVAHTGQEVWIQNEDAVTHTVHPLAHANPELNRSQPPGTDPVVIRYNRPEIIAVKCELHSWMRGVLAVFPNSHHAVTDSGGAFSLRDLPAGKYTVTAWHELYGEQSKEIAITDGETRDLDFVFHVTPY
jgi:plastocyanin